MSKNSDNTTVEHHTPAQVSTVNLLHESKDVAAAAPETETSTKASPSQAPVTSKFDPTRLRVSQNFAEFLGTRKVLAAVPVTKPSKQQWVRVHPEAAYRVDVALIEDKESRTMYVVAPNLVLELETEVFYATLYTTITREGVVFLWPVRLPDADARPNSWNDSAREAASEARDHWVRMSANMSLGGYDYWVAPGTLGEPGWPEQSFEDLLTIAFKGGRIIESLDHPFVVRLKGVK